jgi:archaemetzincin
MAPEFALPQRLRLASLAMPAGLPHATLAELISRHVALACVSSRTVPPPLPELPGRDQWDARALLDWLASTRAPHELLLGLTGRDLGLPIFSHVFGLAQQGGAVAVVSVARLDPTFEGWPADPRLWLRRALAEMLHELGHVAGLAHCPEPACLMRFAGTVGKVDARGEVFCAACAARLPIWLRPTARLRWPERAAP